jgi:hypothetical protein
LFFQELPLLLGQDTPAIHRHLTAPCQAMSIRAFNLLLLAFALHESAGLEDAKGMESICEYQKKLGTCAKGATVAWNQKNCKKSCAGDKPPVPKKASCSDQKLSGLKDSFKETEIKQMMKIMNSMRCVLGAPELKWDKDLACQCQHDEDTNPHMVHTPGLPSLPGWGKGLTGENIMATMEHGMIPEKDKIPMAAFAWFTEYMNQCKGSFWMSCPETGHYSGIAWRAVTSIGCGITRATKGKDGSIRCQFHVGEDNAFSGDVDKMIFMPGHFPKQAPYFEGTKKQFENPKCKFSFSDLKKWSKAMIKPNWGILHAKAEFKNKIGLFIETNLESNIISGDQHFSTMGVAAVAVTGVAFVAMGVAVRRKTRGSDVAPGNNRDEELLESSLE